MPLPAHSSVSRRSLLRLLFAIPVLAFAFRAIRPAKDDSLVEIDGWILRRSDLDRSDVS